MRRAVLLLLLAILSSSARAAVVPAVCADVVVAEAFARRAHADQRYGELAFSEHLAYVHRILRAFGFDDSNPRDSSIFVTAWLHDVLEDTTVSRDAIVAVFGEAIARSVDVLTLTSSQSRREALLGSLDRMQDDEVALVVKLADRIANVDVCRTAFLRTGGSLCYTTYVAEWRYLREPFCRLAGRGRANALWRYLDSLHGSEQVALPTAAGCIELKR